MLDKERIRELLGTGLSNEVVANAVGCEGSYIAQLMSDPVFANEVVLARSIALTANTKRDRAIDSIEDKLIDKLEELVDTQAIYKPAQVLQAFRMVNAAKRRGVPAHTNITQVNNIVQLMLPTKLAQSFTITPQGEVIEVHGEEEGDRQTLVTMPTHTLLQQLAKGEKGGTEIYKEVAKYLPTAAGKV